MIKTPNKLGIEGYFLNLIRTSTKNAQLILYLGFPDGSDSKESSCSVGYLDSIPGSRRSPGEQDGYPLQYSCVENPMDRRAWWATVHGFTKSRRQLSD